MTATFRCRRCGECCRIPGQVHLTETDIVRMATLLGLRESDFIQQHTELARDRRDLVLKVKPDGVCIFLEANGCMVYPARPQQCMDYPVKWNNPDWPQPCWGVRAQQLQTAAEQISGGGCCRDDAGAGGV